MLKAKIAVFVSGGGTNLQALIDAANEGVLKSGEIVLVVSNKQDARAIDRAAANGIKTAVVPSAGRERDEFEGELLKLCGENGIEMIVLAGFMFVLSGQFTSLFQNRIINVHPSLIPSFCGKGYYGLRVHEAALSYGVKITGATVHFVNEITDGGEIILQKAVAVKKNDTSETLQKRVMREAEWKILPKAAELVSKGIISGGNSLDKSKRKKLLSAQSASCHL